MTELRPAQFDIIYLATDHAGLTLKNDIKAWLESEDFIVVDGGAEEFLPEDDFPDYIMPIAEAVTLDRGRAGAIIFGGSGQGEAMAANRRIGIRAVVYYGGNEKIPVLGREHNNANVLSLGARFVSPDEARRVVWEWLHTPCLTDIKYERRNQKIDLTY